jgi:hypothetical protein
MKQTRTHLKRIGVLTLGLSMYPLLVLIYTWGYVLRSDLEGGRHGPLDAYRHALASAVVSYTLGEKAVDITTGLMESKGKQSNTMDRHNNMIGAQIGSIANSFTDIEPLVHQKVVVGAVNSTDNSRITWLPEEKWRDAFLW